jgi:hypothetical protein
MPTIIEPFDRRTVVVVRVADADAVTGYAKTYAIRPTSVTITYQQRPGDAEPYFIGVEAVGPRLRKDGTATERKGTAYLHERAVWPSWVVAAVRRHTPPPFAPDAVVTREV